MTVCSRICDYDKLTIKLRLHTAIIVQSLSREHMRQYVYNIGFPITHSSRSPMWERLDTPLMLNRATLTYVERRRSQLLLEARYSAVATTHYLAWLAWQMRRYTQTIFYHERIQRGELPHEPCRVLRLLDTLLVGRLYGLLSDLGFGLGPSGLLGGLVGDGNAWLRHYLIRFLLVPQRIMPWRYVAFLDCSTDRILLRNVGDGYICIHRLLPDNVAEQYTQTETSELPMRSTRYLCKASSSYHRKPHGKATEGRLSTHVSGSYKALQT